LKVAVAGAPKPRQHLREALAKLADARSVLAKLERAAPAARAAVTAAQERHDAATRAAEATNVNAAEGLAVAFYEGTKLTDPARAAAAARGELAAATDALVVARNARTILDSKLKDAQAAVGYASDRAKKAARGVLVAEKLADLLADAAEAHGHYIESIGQIAWLMQQHAIPDGDASRVRQLVADGNCPPSTWSGADTAGVDAMEQAMTALLADPAAPI
jgi:hypothetical protein